MGKTKGQRAWLPWPRLLALWAGAGLVGNFLWEILQRPLYAG